VTLRNFTTPANDNQLHHAFEQLTCASSAPVLGIACLYRYGVTSFRAADAGDAAMRSSSLAQLLGIALHHSTLEQPVFLPQCAAYDYTALLGNLLQRAHVTFVAYDWQAIIKTLMLLGVCTQPVHAQVFDLKVAAWVWNPEQSSFAYPLLLSRFVPAAYKSAADVPSNNTSNALECFATDLQNSIVLYRYLNERLHSGLCGVQAH
jgi:DNA polymerase I-like protein with 3'-5' exonuclease and polymerase domains